MPTPSIEARFALAQIAIGNALADPTLSAALATYGYTAERLRQGDVLRETARAFHQRQKEAYGDLFAAGDALDAARRQVQATYMRHVKLARVAFENDRGATQKLALAGERKQSLVGQLAQAQQFYASALSDSAILNKLAGFGITQALLEAGQRQVDAVGAGNAARRQRKGAAQDATRMRDDALTALDAWMSDFTKIARVALKGRPQLLEKVGIAAPVRSAARIPAVRDEGTPTSEAASVIPDSHPLIAKHRDGSNGAKVAAMPE